MPKIDPEEIGKKHPRRDGKRLAPRQLEALRAIEVFWSRNRMPPARTDVARAMGLKSGASADVHIYALQRKQAISIVPHESRGIRLVNPPELPLVPDTPGTNGEREPSAPERIANWIPRVLAKGFNPTPDHFMELGEKNAARLDLKTGQVVAVKATTDPEEGDIAVAWLDEKLICGRFSQTEKHKVELHALNRAVPRAIRRVHLHQRNFTIEGIVVGVLRGEPLRVPAT